LDIEFNEDLDFFEECSDLYDDCNIEIDREFLFERFGGDESLTLNSYYYSCEVN